MILLPPPIRLHKSSESIISALLAPLCKSFDAHKQIAPESPSGAFSLGRRSTFRLRRHCVCILRRTELRPVFTQSNSGTCTLGTSALSRFSPSSSIANFKAKYFVLNVPLASVVRHSPAVNPVATCNPRTSRLYFNIGSLPYFDNVSGIPRLAQNHRFCGM